MGGATRVWWRGVELDGRTRDMMAELARITPDLPYIRPSQGSYSDGKNSAGTHSGGGAIDVDLDPGWTSSEQTELIRRARRIGFAAWVRSPAQGPWGWHSHMIAIGCPDLSATAADQVIAYRAGRNGLANNGPDDGPDVPFTTWEQYREDEMALDASGTNRAVWKRETMNPPGDHGGGRGDPKHWTAESVVVFGATKAEQAFEEIRESKPFASPYLADQREKQKKSNKASLRWLIEWAWHYAHGARDNAGKAARVAEANGKRLAALDGRLAGLESAIQQMANSLGHTIDMAAVRQAAQAGAADALAELDATVTLELAADDGEDEG